MTKKFYITTPIYYLNALPHIGHAYTTLAADIMARYKKAQGVPVHFLTGTDEHGANIERSAQNANVSPQEWTDNLAQKFKELWAELNINYDDFIRTTEPRHERTVQEVFEVLLKKGDIYKGKYSGKYCMSCEAYIDESELLPNDLCPIHKKPTQFIEEETYFFKLSAYGELLLKFYEANPTFLSPKFRSNEIINFVKSGLKDLSVTRTKVKWGVPVLSDPNHTIYVWFDALVNYISAIGYGKKLGLSEYADYKYNFDEFWPAEVHLLGKEISRFHSVIWPAVLMALGLPLPGKTFAHGWWTIEGEKMSKSRGNFIDPRDITTKYGVDSLRYFLFREVPFGGDGDFSMDSFKKRFNADLANDLGNLLSRTLNMAAKTVVEIPQNYTEKSNLLAKAQETNKTYFEQMDNLAFDKALDSVWFLIGDMNKYIDETKPWMLAKSEPEKAKAILLELIFALKSVVGWISPFMPKTAEEMARRLAVGPIEKYAPLFPRIEAEPKHN
ncbi:MAG: methionine--tRNA ligase [Elusimicrobiota bacterium]|jgi:methionyl-tRNA synthetase|nr:methionine--tRNA ligase [Elusimicrobiota bacterium]